MANAHSIVQPVQTELAPLPRVEVLRERIPTRVASIAFAELTALLAADAGVRVLEAAQAERRWLATLAAVASEVTLLLPDLRLAVASVGAARVLVLDRHAPLHHGVAVVVGLGEHLGFVVDEGRRVRRYEFAHGAIIALHAPRAFDWHPVPRRPSPHAIAATFLGTRS